MAGSGKTEPCASNESRLNAKASSDELAIRFHYDAQDALIGCSTSAGKEQRFYRNDELASEILGGASTAFVRAEGMVLAEHQAGSDPKSLLLAGDDKNSVLCEISQATVKGVAYSPYGHRIDDASVGNHLGYNGERRERQTGWYLLGKGYRVFNPLLMRFHSPDNLSPFGERGLNAYMYCVGDPINNVDPTGHIPSGGVVKLFTHTTESAKYLPGFEKIPDSFLRANPDKAVLGIESPASMNIIRPQDVKVLKKRMGFYGDVVGFRKADYLTYGFRTNDPGLLLDQLAAKSEYLRSVKVFEAAQSEYQFARTHTYRFGMTRHSRRDFEIIAGADKKMIALADRVEQEKYFKKLKLGAAEMENIREVAEWPPNG